MKIQSAILQLPSHPQQNAKHYISWIIIPAHQIISTGTHRNFSPQLMKITYVVVFERRQHFQLSVSSFGRCDVLEYIWHLLQSYSFAIPWICHRPVTTQRTRKVVMQEIFKSKWFGNCLHLLHHELTYQTTPKAPYPIGLSGCVSCCIWGA